MRKQWEVFSAFVLLPTDYLVHSFRPETEENFVSHAIF